MKALAHLGKKLSCFQLVLQATVCNGCAFDLRALIQDCLTFAETDIGWGEIFDAFAISLVVVIDHYGSDLSP